MLQIIQNNLKFCPKTLPNLIWNKITNGIELRDNELIYLKKHKIKNIVEFGLTENGCWIIDSYKAKSWYKYGKKHREDGPAIERPNGNKEYWVNGLRHREEGPAVEAHGYKAYYLNNKRHRKGGPAIEYSNGFKEYWEDGNKLAITN